MMVEGVKYTTSKQSRPNRHPRTPRHAAGLGSIVAVGDGDAQTSGFGVNGCQAPGYAGPWHDDKRQESVVRRFLHDERGVNAIEFAMVFPVFVAMLFGVIQMGLALYTSSSIQYALEKTARAAMLDGDISASTLQQQFAAQLDEFTDKNVVLAYSTENAGGVEIVVLKTNYVHAFEIPLVPVFEMTFPVEVRVPVAG
jgi:Flp pilus assembly pilin Flp